MSTQSVSKLPPLVTLICARVMDLLNLKVFVKKKTAQFGRNFVIFLIKYLCIVFSSLGGL